MTPKQKAWNIFSEWVRRSNANDQGFVKCYTCTAFAHWKYMHSGHCFSRKDNAVFINEIVVKVQCPVCNIDLMGNTELFKKNLVKEYGFEVIEQVARSRHETVKKSAREWNEIAKFYKEKLKALD